MLMGGQGIAIRRVSTNCCGSLPRWAQYQFLRALCGKCALQGRVDLGDLARQSWQPREGTNYRIPSKVICRTGRASWNRLPMGARAE